MTEEDTSAMIVEILRKEKLRSGKTINKIEVENGLSTKTLTDVLDGKRDPRLTTLVKLLGSFDKKLVVVDK